jgi:hypothetical protein
MPRIPVAISRSVWLPSCTALAGGAILMAAAARPASFGGADDRDACAEASGSAAIAACTRAITSSATVGA